MTVEIGNTTLTNTFDYWRNRTNEMADAMSIKVVTVDSNTAVGNAAISGTFTANVFSGNGSLLTSVDADTVGGNTVSTINSYADNKAANAYSNAVSYAGTIAATAYSNATSYADTVAANAYSNAVSYAASIAATAYSNSVSYFDSNVNTAIDTRVTKSFVDALNVDADTLDGQQGSYYQNASNLNAGTIADARISGSYTGMTNLTGSGTVDFAKFHGNAADSVSAPSFSWTGDTNTGIYQPAADQVGITCGGAERMRINASGNLLLGTTSTFDNVSFLRGQFLGGLSTKIDTVLTTTQISFFNPNGRAGYIATSGTSTSYITSSDYRLKENVAPLAGAAERLAQIPVYRFNFIADPDATVDGFLAHEVQEFVPEAITGTKDEVDDEGNPVYQGIDQSKLVPLLTAALQEALADIATLKAEVAALKGEPA